MKIMAHFFNSFSALGLIIFFCTLHRVCFSAIHLKPNIICHPWQFIVSLFLNHLNKPNCLNTLVELLSFLPLKKMRELCRNDSSVNLTTFTFKSSNRKPIARIFRLWTTLYYFNHFGLWCKNIWFSSKCFWSMY